MIRIHLDARIPLHATVAVGHGRLQARRAFAQFATGLGIWSIARILIVTIVMTIGSAPVPAFVLALPAALVVELAFLVGLGAYHGIRWQRAPDSSQLLSHYALWALFAWIVNADAIFALLFLSAADADKYAIAITLGRQPVYAVAPLAMVLLPVTLGAQLSTQRHRLYAILLVCLLLATVTFLILGVQPHFVVAVLTGSGGRADDALIRGYAVAGFLIAAATLLLTFTFALDRAPRLTGLCITVVASTLAVAALVHGPRQLLCFQFAAVGLLVVQGTCIGLRATARTHPDVRAVLSPTSTANEPLVLTCVRGNTCGYVTREGHGGRTSG